MHRRTAETRRRTSRAVTPFVVALLAVAAAAPRAPAQASATPPPEERGSSRPDSAAVAGAARERQAAFERRRRALLPTSHGAARRCDEMIGRWCYWYDAREPDVPAEPVAIARARDALIDVLAEAADAAPTDAWIVGQRVRYLVEAGRAPEAARSADACGADAAWCAALLGYAQHAAGDAVAAERAFDDALARMPRDTACRWLDPRPLLPSGERAAFGAACTSAHSLVARFWRHATPFLSRGANDRRNEHLARRVLARLLRDARFPYADRWSDDLEELLVRYGWPDRWSRRASGSIAESGVVAIGHEPWPSYRFTPDAAALHDPLLEPSPLDDPRARERASAVAARFVVELRTRAAAFRRGDSLRVVVAVAAPPDTLRARFDSARVVALPIDASRADLPAMRAIALPPAARRTFSDGAVAAAVTVLAAPSLVGIEAVGDTAVALRGRAAVAPATLADGFGMSDLLPFAPDDHDRLPATLDEAADAAIPATIRTGAPLGLFWELYGLADDARGVEIALHVETEPPGWLSRVLGRLRGRAPTSPPRLRWTDVGAGGAVAPRAVRLDAALLPAGRHELVLTARHPDGRTASARLAIVVTR